MKIEFFCEAKGLGKVLNITKLFGGLMHKMFKVETSKATYAIKVLNPEVMSRSDAYDNFVVSETISNLAKENGIPVSNALRIDGEFITKFDGNYFMVFEYIDGKTLTDDEITAEHCEKIGEILAEIHSLDYSNLGIDAEVKEDHFYVDWESFLKNNNFNKMSYKDLYIKNYKKYYSILKRAVERFNESNKSIAICHMDMDPKNVMWSNGNPIIIDWESASIGNPYRELVEVALSWSGFLTNNFDAEKFKIIVSTYTKKHPFEHNRYDIICGNLIGRFGWLDYNLKRSLGIKTNDEEEMVLAEKEVIKTIDEINRYLELIGTMYNIICDLTKKENHDFDSVVETIMNNNSILEDLDYKKVNAGFTNTIYSAENYIIRICTDESNEERFANEISFYNDNKDNYRIPKLFVADTSKNIVPYYYEIMEKVDGQPLYEIWYKLTLEERKNIVLLIIDILRTFHSKKVESYDFKTFIKNKIRTLLNECEIDDKLFLDLLIRCDIYFEQNKFGVIHNDLHFDNFIYNNGILKLIDFERCMIAPIDYDFRIFNRFTETPWLWASGTTGMLTVENDYQNLMEMFVENYDELKSIPYLKERLSIYEIIDLLNDYKKTKNKDKLDLIKSKIINI